MRRDSSKQTERGVPDLHHPPTEAIVLLDRNGIIQWTSPSIYDLLGFQTEELKGQEIFRLLYWSSVQKIKSQYKEFQHHKQMMNEGLKQFRNKKGGMVALHVTLGNLLSHPAINGIILNLRLFREEESLLSRQTEAELEKEVFKKTLEEIGAELHDNIGSSLAGVKLIFDHSIKNPAEHSDELEKVSGILNVLVRDVRNLSHGIAKEDKENFSLSYRLNLLIENFSKIKTLRILLKYDNRLESLLKYEQKIQIFRILQEQVSNIVRHAKATKAIISLQLMDGRVKITTRDNGKGFNPGNGHNGIGLSNMLFRVNKLGGHLQINSEPGSGTTISIVFLHGLSGN